MLFFHLRKWTGNEREKYWTLVPIIEEYFALLISWLIHWFSVFWEEIKPFLFLQFKGALKRHEVTVGYSGF